MAHSAMLWPLLWPSGMLPGPHCSQGEVGWRAGALAGTRGAGGPRHGTGHGARPPGARGRRAGRNPVSSPNAIYYALVRNDAVCLYVTSAHRSQSPEAKSSSPSSSTVAKKSGIAKRTPDVTRPTRCAFSHPELKTRARPCTCETHRERETRDGAVSAGEWSGMNAPAPAV